MPVAVQAQQILGDKTVQSKCAGLVLIFRSTEVACPRSINDADQFNTEAQKLTEEFNNTANRFCSNHSISGLSAEGRGKALKLVDIINNDEQIASISNIECKTGQVIAARKAENAAMRLFSALFDAPKSQVRCSSGKKNQSDCIDTKLSMDDLKGLFDAMPVKKNFDLAKKAFDLSYDATNTDSQMQIGSSIAQLIQSDGGSLAEQLGQTMVKLQINSTPGATPNSIDLQTINFLKNEIPKMINKMFAPSFE
jgi:hypothetical protein